MPQKQDIDLTKFPMGLVFDTPNFEDILKIREEYNNPIDVLNRLTNLCLAKGFRVYRHSLGAKHAETRLLIMCSCYSSTRCPFLLTYKKPDLPDATFMLLKYRSEHNH